MEAPYPVAHDVRNQAPATAPYWLMLDLETLHWLDGLDYLPRQDASANGTIAEYALDVSLDGLTWTSAAQGTFMPAGKTARTVRFPAIQARYARLTVLREVQNLSYASAAEIRVMGSRCPGGSGTPNGTHPDLRVMPGRHGIGDSVTRLGDAVTCRREGRLYPLWVDVDPRPGTAIDNAICHATNTGVYRPTTGYPRGIQKATTSGPISYSISARGSPATSHARKLGSVLQG